MTCARAYGSHVVDHDPTSYGLAESAWHDAMATLSVRARLVGHSRDILGHFLSFIHGLGDPSQLPVGDADADADADADVALACQWGASAQCRTWLQCIMIDVFEADVFSALMLASSSLALLSPDRIST